MSFVAIYVFEGVELRRWIDWLETKFEQVKLSDLQKLNLAMTLIEGEAAAYLQQSRLRIRNWHALKSVLLFRFGDDDDPEKLRIQASNRRFLERCRQTKARRDAVKIRSTEDSVPDTTAFSDTVSIGKSCASKSQIAKHLLATEVTHADSQSLGHVNSLPRESSSEDDSSRKEEVLLQPTSFPKEVSLSVLESAHREKLFAVQKQVVAPMFDNLQSEVAVNVDQSTCFETTQCAYQLLDVLPLKSDMMHLKLEKDKLSKSWKFKFKLRPSTAVLHMAPLSSKDFATENSVTTVSCPFLVDLSLGYGSNTEFVHRKELVHVFPARDVVKWSQFRRDIWRIHHSTSRQQFLKGCEVAGFLRKKTDSWLHWIPWFESYTELNQFLEQNHDNPAKARPCSRNCFDRADIATQFDLENSYAGNHGCGHMESSFCVGSGAQSYTKVVSRIARVYLVWKSGGLVTLHIKDWLEGHHHRTELLARHVVARFSQIQRHMVQNRMLKKELQPVIKQAATAALNIEQSIQKAVSMCANELSGTASTQEMQNEMKILAQTDMSFSGLTPFGTGFVSNLKCSQMLQPLLETVTIVDTPRIFSGQRQWTLRAFEFTGVTPWLASKCDLLLLRIDTHKLDVNSESSLQEDGPIVFKAAPPYTVCCHDFFGHKKARMSFLFVEEALGLFQSLTGIHVNCFVLSEHEDILSTTKKLKCCKSWHFKYKTKSGSRNKVGTMQFVVSWRFVWCRMFGWYQFIEEENANYVVATMLLVSELVKWIVASSALDGSAIADKAAAAVFLSVQNFMSATSIMWLIWYLSSITQRMDSHTNIFKFPFGCGGVVVVVETIITGKTDVKVKALEAAEATKRIVEQKETEPKTTSFSSIEMESTRVTKIDKGSLLIQLTSCLLRLQLLMAHKAVKTGRHQFFAIWHRWRIRDCIQCAYCLMEQWCHFRSSPVGAFLAILFIVEHDTNASTTPSFSA